MEFDLIGIDASIANAIRRILISEVPTIAIEKVYIYDNTSVMHDEILAHRLGLIPIKADPDEFEFRQGSDDPLTDLNTIVFSLNVTCKKNPDAAPDALDPNEKYIHSNVVSGDLKWEPQGSHLETFGEDGIHPVFKDILLVKLRPQQRIHAELHCQKGIAKEHAKWSPVATASYRLLPEIKLLQPITGKDADKFKSCFPKGVVSVEKNKNGVKEAKIVNPRKDTVSREVLRHPEFQGKVALNRIRDHFIFSIESTGIMTPDLLFIKSVRILKQKCLDLKNAVQELGV